MKTLAQFQQVLKEELSTLYFDIEDEILYDFKDYPFAEITPNITEHFGISLTFVYMKEHKTFFEELFRSWPTLIPDLQEYLTALYIENTKGYPCSFNIEFDTNHLDQSEEAIWEIRLSVTDSFS